MLEGSQLVDIFNDRYDHIGTEDKRQAHRQGLWHRTFSALALHPTRRRVLLQRKTPSRYSFGRPDYADINVGGHYHAGESVPEGIREVHEELGLPLDYSDLHPVGLRQTAVTLAPDYIEREFQHWHLIPLDLDLDAIPLATRKYRDWWRSTSTTRSASPTASATPHRATTPPAPTTP